jgi:hypothetical protein
MNADMVAEEELQEKGLPGRVVVEAEDVWHELPPAATAGDARGVIVAAAVVMAAGEEECGGPHGAAVLAREGSGSGGASSMSKHEQAPAAMLPLAPASRAERR